jgi:hypothetical protein
MLKKSRLTELSGFNKGEEPLLMTESGPVYKTDLQEMIQEELQKALHEMQVKKNMDQLQYAQQTRSVGAAMGFTGIGFGGFKQDQTRVSYGAGGTRAILGPGFR